MRRIDKKLLLLSLLCGLYASVGARRVFAQGCALCYTTAAAAGSAAARSLDIGILVLLVPSLLLFISVLAFTIRRAEN